MKRLLLVGGGHAQLEVLHALRQAPLPNVEIVLVAPSPTAAYTGMIPGMLDGEHAMQDLTFDLPVIARAAGAVFRQGTVTAVNGAARTAVVDGVPLAFDVCSINVGSVAAGLEVPGARQHAVPLRPLSNALLLRDRLDALCAGSDAGGFDVVVAGGGAAGIEVAIALQVRASGRARVTVVHGERTLLDASASRAAARVEAACARAGVTVRLQRRIVRVADTHVHLDDGTTLPSALTAWLTGAAPPPMLADSTLPLSARGLLHVDDTLRAVTGVPVWGAGDCADLAAHPWVPRAGVYAVREGRVLAHNLRQAMTGMGHPRVYRPQAHFLSILATGRGRALLTWRGLVVEGRWPRWLKRRIDTAFMARHQGAR